MGIQKICKVHILTLKENFDQVISKLFNFKLFHVTESSEERIEEIEKNIQRLSKALAEIDTLLSELKIKKNFSVIDYLTQGKPFKKINLEFNSFEHFINISNNQLNNFKRIFLDLINERKNRSKELENLKQEKFQLEYLNKLAIPINEFQYIKNFNVFLVLVNSKVLTELKRSLPEDVFLTFDKLKEDLFLCLIIINPIYQEKINRILGGLELKVISLDFLKYKSIDDRLNFIEKKIEENRKKIEEIKTKILKETEKQLANLLALYEAIYLEYLNILNIKISKSLKHFITLEGYIPVKFKKVFINNFKDIAYIYFEELNKEEEKNAPSLIQNLPIINSFERITFMHGPARYNEIEPTIFIFFFFTLFYGYMFADVGGGTILALLGLLIYKRTTDILKKWGILIFFLGLSSIIFGFLHNEFFGFKVPFIEYKPLIKMVDHEEGKLISSGIMLVLQISILIGVFHISLGMFFRVFNGFKNKNYEDIILGLSYLIFYLSSVFLIYGLLILGFNFNEFINGTTKILNIPSNIYSKMFSILALVGLILLALSRYITHKIEKLKHVSLKETLGEGFIEVFDALTRLLANTISYVRLAVLVIVHTVLLLNLSKITEISLGIPVITVIVVTIGLIFGNLGIILLEGFIVFIQALRLHLYEWFTKFYYGDGKIFKTFNSEGQFSKIILKTS